MAFRLGCQGKTVRDKDNMTDTIQDIRLQAIGVVRSAFLRREQTPKQGRETSARADLEIFPAYREGLQGLAELKHAFILTWLLGKLVDVTIGLRVGQFEESVGLDISQHGERAYGGMLR